MRVALLLLVAAGATDPVTRVVELLEKLQTDARTDQEAEQKTYDKYACWCETTTKRKAAAIDQAKADIRTASNDVLALRGKRATLASEIEDHAEEIHDNEDAAHTLTLVRQKSASDAQYEIAKMQQTVGALDTAIRLVKLKPGLVATKVDKALKGAATETLSKVDHPAVKSLVQMLNGSPASDYESLHPKLLKILTSLHAIFNANTESEEDTEKTAKATFTTLLGTKTEETSLLAASVKDKENLLAQRAQELAQREQELLDLHDQMDADKDFFDKAVSDCTAESNAWDERNRRRNEELSGISKALELLTAPETRANFQASFSFVQLRAAVTPLAAGSPRLAALASAAMTKAIAKAKGDGDEDFDAKDFAKTGIQPVIDAIGTMQTELQDEEADDIEQRDWCIAEQTNYTHQSENLTYDIQVLDNKITKLTEENAKFNEEIDDTNEKLAELAQEVSDAGDLRAEQNTAYNTAKAQDEEAQRVLNETIEALEAFYANNSLDVHNAAPTGAGAPRTVLAQVRRARQPDFAISEDAAPGTVATNETFGGNTEQTKAILDLIQMLVDNLVNDVAAATAAENKSESDYQAFLTASAASKLAMEERVTNLENAEGTNLDKITGHEGVKETAEDERNAVGDYLEKIAPNCDWIRGAFYTRLGRRKQEMDGLTDAKSLLAGGEAVTMVAKHSSVRKTLDVASASTDQLLDSLDEDDRTWSKRARMAELVARHRMWQTVVAKPKKHGPPKHHAARQEHAKAAPAAKAFLSRE
jgi:hypothetical protein